MPLPKISIDVFRGLTASKKANPNMFMEKFDQMLEDKCLEDMLDVLIEDCEKNSRDPEEASAGVVLGMVYTYMLLNAQVESDELKKQWEL